MNLTESYKSIGIAAAASRRSSSSIADAVQLLCVHASGDRCAVSWSRLTGAAGESDGRDLRSRVPIATWNS